MKVITLRNLPPRLAREIETRARQTSRSLARTVILLLEERLGLGEKPGAQRIHHDLDHLAGKWSAEEAAQFERALAVQRKVDPELWG